MRHHCLSIDQLHCPRKNWDCQLDWRVFWGKKIISFPRKQLRYNEVSYTLVLHFLCRRLLQNVEESRWPQQIDPPETPWRMLCNDQGLHSNRNNPVNFEVRKNSGGNCSFTGHRLFEQLLDSTWITGCTVQGWWELHWGSKWRNISKYFQIFSLRAELFIECWCDRPSKWIFARKHKKLLLERLLKTKIPLQMWQNP